MSKDNDSKEKKPDVDLQNSEESFVTAKSEESMESALEDSLPTIGSEVTIKTLNTTDRKLSPLENDSPLVPDNNSNHDKNTPKMPSFSLDDLKTVASQEKVASSGSDKKLGDDDWEEVSYFSDNEEYVTIENLNDIAPSR